MQKVIGTEKQVIGNVYLGSNLYSRNKLESRQAGKRARYCCISFWMFFNDLNERSIKLPDVRHLFLENLVKDL